MANGEATYHHQPHRERGIHAESTHTCGDNLFARSDHRLELLSVRAHHVGGLCEETKEEEEGSTIGEETEVCGNTIM